MNRGCVPLWQKPRDRVATNYLPLLTPIKELHMATIDLTKDTFEKAVTSDGIVLVDAWADWCLSLIHI